VKCEFEAIVHVRGFYHQRWREIRKPNAEFNMVLVEFFFDVGSPYSYLASTQIAAIVADCGASLRWRPFLVGAVFKSTGNTAPAFNVAKARYMANDLQRWAEYYGVPLRVALPPNSTLLPMRILAGMPDSEQPAAAVRLFHAWWVEGLDFNDLALLTQWFGETAVQRAGEQEVKDRLRLSTEEAVQRGAFGAPTLFVGEEMFFGNDRLPFLEQHLRKFKRF